MTLSSQVHQSASKDQSLNCTQMPISFPSSKRGRVWQKTSMYDEDGDNLPTSSFQTYSAEGDQLAKQGNFKQAIESYTSALQLRPNDKTCLVFRSKCYLLMGDSASALSDANLSLKDDKTFFKGIFQKAEALYATGDFEMALVYYHRGNKLRPEFNDFRLGIQKASEAIDNSIGSKSPFPNTW